MNIEERLDAIAQHVQILSGMQIETEKRVARLEESSIRLKESSIRLNEVIVRFAELPGRHEERLDDLEQGNRPKQ